MNVILFKVCVLTMKTSLENQTVLFQQNAAYFTERTIESLLLNATLDDNISLISWVISFIG